MTLALPQSGLRSYTICWAPRKQRRLINEGFLGLGREEPTGLLERTETVRDTGVH